MDLLLSGEFEVRLLHVQLILKSAFPWHERLNINERRVGRGIYFVINKNVLLSFQYEYSNKIGPTLLISMHLHCFIVCCAKIAAIHAVLVCTIFGPQIWSGTFLTNLYDSLKPQNALLFCFLIEDTNK